LNCSILFGVVLITHTFTHALLSSHQLTLIDLTFSGRLAVNISQFNISGDLRHQSDQQQRTNVCSNPRFVIGRHYWSFFYGPRFRIVEKAKQPKNS